jgi:hypothetical protein
MGASRPLFHRYGDSTCVDDQTREMLRRQHFEKVARLTKIAETLPAGVLHRLLLDAEFYRDWSRGKKVARASARFAQEQKRGTVRSRR